MSLNNIKAIGFDLDNTLYSQTPEVDTKIQDYICEKAAKMLGKEKNQLRSEFNQYYTILQSASRALIVLGVPTREKAKEIVQESLEEADVASVLNIDKNLCNMLERLAKSHKLFLITGSRENIAQSKLSALGIDPLIFNPRIYSGDKNKRDDGTAFKYVSELLGIPYERIMFVGDREKVDIIPASQLGITTAIVNAKSEHATYNLLSIYDLEKILL